MADPLEPPERGTQARTAWNDRVRAGRLMTHVNGARPRRKRNPNPVCQPPVIHGPTDNFSDSFGNVRKRYLGQGEAREVGFSLSLVVAEDVKAALLLSRSLVSLAIRRTPLGIHVRNLFAQISDIHALAAGYAPWFQQVEQRFSRARPTFNQSRRQQHFCTVDAGLDKKLKEDVLASHGLLGRLLTMYSKLDTALQRKLGEALRHYKEMQRLGAQPPSGGEPTAARQKAVRAIVAQRLAALRKARTQLKPRLFIGWSRQAWKNRGGHPY